MTPTPSERRQLENFRRAARQVREASIIASGQTIEIRSAPGEPGYVDIYVGLLENEPFRSLAAALRLVYQQGEPAHFYTICNLLYRISDEGVQQRVTTIRAQYRDVFHDSAGRVVVGDGPSAVAFDTKEVFEHWLYGVVFHQDDDRQSSVDLLVSAGAFFPWSVQSTGLQVAGRTLDLDDLVADFLSEARLPRI